MEKKVAIRFIAISTLFSPAIAFAAGGGKASIGDLAWYFTNFTLYAVLLTYLLKDVLRRSWKQRREDIETAVNRGEREMQAAKAALMEATEKVSSLTPEYLEGVATQIETEAKEEAKRVLAIAEQSTEQIKQNAEQSISAERAKNEATIRNDIAELVVQKAAERIKGSYSEELDKERRGAALSGSASLVQ